MLGANTLLWFYALTASDSGGSTGSLVFLAKVLKLVQRRSLPTKRKARVAPVVSADEKSSREEELLIEGTIIWNFETNQNIRLATKRGALGFVLIFSNLIRNV